jgi:glycine dehydrogenase
MFDTLSIKVKNAKEIMDYFEKHEINLTQLNEDTISIALNEVTTLADLEELLKHFNKLSGKKP